MKKIIYLIFIITFLLTAHTKSIKLPSEATLIEKLSKLKDDDYSQETTIIQKFLTETKVTRKLADQSLSPIRILMIIESTIDRYCTKLCDPMTTIKLQLLRPRIVERIMQDYPEELERIIFYT